MTFDEVLDQVRELLQQRGRLTYGAMKRRFGLDDAYLADIKDELIEAEQVARDENDKVLVWTGGETPSERPSRTTSAPVSELPSSARSPQPAWETPAGERRQLTVMFCDLVGFTALSERLDPEELHQMVRTYQHTCAEVITRYEGHIAQYLGDGLLVYFGFPTAHEDDATRAVRTSLEVLAQLSQLETVQPLHVRIGIHTGQVVVGEVGAGGRREQLAVGETPNIAARVQGRAAPDEVLISAATQQLVAGLFELEDRGEYALKGISTPQPLYRVKTESGAQSRFEVALRRGVTPLVGRELEVQLLDQWWTQAQAGNGRAVLLSGEPGIGKSRLVQELKAQVTQAGATQIEFRCSPYHQNSALYPIIEHLQRFLQFTPHDTTQTKLAKLQQTLGRYRFPQPETFPLLAALLSLPHPEGVPPITVSPQKQKEQTQTALVAWLLEETDQRPVYNAWEDLHWADPSTLELLALLLLQVPTTRILAVLTFRPEFVPPWGMHSYLSQLTLTRLGHPQVSAMVARVTGGKALPEEVLQQIVTKTDGVPLFVEELTKMVVESNLVRAVNSHYELTGPLPPLAIPATLQDSLMARLDRLAPAREVAQLGATIGREFSYLLLHAAASLEEEPLHQGLKQLVDTELVYQHGLPPQAHYIFKHALIQDTAYQSLLMRTRQHYHQQIAQVLEAQFAEVVESQPELVAHHYTEASCLEQAISYWQRAGQRAVERSANAEAVSHLTTGLAVLATLPATAERAEQELAMQTTLGPAFIALKGYAAPEVEQTYRRALELCRQEIGSLQHFSVLYGLWWFDFVAAKLPTALEQAEELLSLAQRQGDPVLLLAAYRAVGYTLYDLGKFTTACEQLEEGIARYDRQLHSQAVLYGGTDPGVGCLCFVSMVLWYRGYPDQALQRMHEALALARRLAHPLSLAACLNFAARVRQFRREAPIAQEQAEATVAFSTEQGFTYWLAEGSILRGWALAERGQVEDGLTQMHQGLAAYSATGARLWVLYYRALIAEMQGKVGQVEDGLAELTEAISLVHDTGEHEHEAELYRLKGELMLQADAPRADPQIQQDGEACYLQALAVARSQEAKSLELRAATSLARLWHQQGKITEARQLLYQIYSWFTEGFDTPDLQDAKALLEALS